MLVAKSNSGGRVINFKSSGRWRCSANPLSSPLPSPPLLSLGEWESGGWRCSAPPPLLSLGLPALFFSFPPLLC